MASVTTTGAGNWSSGSSVFSGGSGAGGVPTAADTVTVTHDIVVDVMDAVCDTLTINAGGTVRPSTTTNSKLVIDKGITVANSATATLSYDMTSAPTYTAELRWNADNDTGDNTTNQASIAGQATLTGADKKYYTFAEGALTKDSSVQCYADDATGWLVGDMLCFGDTQAGTTTVNITNVTYNTPGAYLEITAAGHGLEVGDQVQFFNLQTGLNQAKYVVSVVSSSSVFRVPSSSVTVSDTSGYLQRQARAEIVTINAITFDNAPTNTGRALVAWIDGLGSGGSLCHDHADNCVVANLTRNVVLSPGVSMGKLMLNPANSTYTRPLSNVLFRNFSGAATGFPDATMIFTSGKFSEITNCVFYNWTGSVQGSSNAGGGDFTRARNTYYNEFNGALYAYGNLSGLISTESDMLILRGGISGMVSVNWVLGNLVNPLISGVVGIAVTVGNAAFTAITPPAPGRASIEGGAIWSCTNVVTQGQGGSGITPITLSNTRLGIGPTGASYSAQNTYLASASGTAPITLDTCPLYSTTEAVRQMGAGGEFIFLNKDEDPGVQEVYNVSSYTVPFISRVTDTISNSTSALMMQWTGTYGFGYARDLNVVIGAGSTETVLVRVRKNSLYGASTLPKVVVYDGTNIVSTVTMSDTADTWETLTISITNSNSADKQYRIRLAGQSAVNGAKCWFAGVPLAPFITKVRWYGYEFVEASAVRNVDITKSVSEVVAAAYNTVNMTFSWSVTAGSSMTSIIADTTFQQLFDGHQAQAVLNVDKAIAVHGAGVAGSPSLFADGNITISTTKKLSGDGSLSMGAYTLTADGYTYTGGTFSQLASTPTFSGGMVAIADEGTYDYTLSSCTVEFGAAGTAWDLSGSTFSDTIAFTTSTGALPITVAVPAGASYTTEGANITVTAAVNTLTIAASVSLIGAEVRVYDLDNTPAGSYGTELGGSESCPTATFSLPIAPGNDVQIQIIKDGYVEFVQSYTMGASATFTAVLEVDTYA